MARGGALIYAVVLTVNQVVAEEQAQIFLFQKALSELSGPAVLVHSHQLAQGINNEPIH